MRDKDTPSVSALLVSYMRGLAPYLQPPADQIMVDPQRLDERLLAGTALGSVLRLLARLPTRIARFFASAGQMGVHLALRTRAIDDIVTEFTVSGGKQVVILGAGLDVRSVRLAPLLSKNAVRVYEVDSPGSQRSKLALMRSSGLKSDALYIAHDFEAEPMAELPEKLARAGLDRSGRSLVLLEGVVPYLTRAATDATIETARKLGGTSSLLVVNHVSPEQCELFAAPWSPWRLHNWHFWALFMAYIRWRAGERIISPSRGGVAWGDQTGAYLAQHGWTLRSNRGEPEEAARIGLPLRFVGSSVHSYIAVAVLSK